MTSKILYAIITKRFKFRPVGQAVKTPPFHGDNRGSIPLRVTTSEQALLVPIFFHKKNQSPALLLLLFRKRSRSRRLFACKRAHNAFGSLPTFCGCAPDGVGFFPLLLFRKMSRSRRLFACKRAHNALHQFSFNGTITCVINLSFSLCWGGPSRKAKRHLSKICILFFSAYLTSFSTTSGSFSYAP